MPSLFTCPSCQRNVQVPERMIGFLVKCPGCQAEFVAGTSPTPASGAPASPTGPDAASWPVPAGTGAEFPGGSHDLAGGNANVFVDYLLFRRMITPVIIQIIFWGGATFSVLLGGFYIVSSLVAALEVGARSGGGIIALFGFLGGLFTMFVGPLIIRVYCEVVIVFFRMNETLTDIKHNTDPGRRA